MSSEFTELFLSESQEILQKASHDLVALESEIKKSGGGSQASRGLMNALFRGFHTLKGMAMMLEHHSIAEVSHEMESVLDGWRKHGVSEGQGASEFLFRGLDVVSGLVRKVADGQGLSQVDVKDELQKMKKGLSLGEPRAGVREEDVAASALSEEEIARCLKTARERKLGLYRLTVHLSASAPLPVATFMILLTRLKGLGEVFAEPKYVEIFKNGKLGRRFDFYLLSSRTASQVGQGVGPVPDVERIDIEEVKGDEPTVERYDGDDRRTHSVRVPLLQLDRLMNLVGEVSISRSRLGRAAAEHEDMELAAAVNEISRLTTELQSEVMRTRLVPLDYIVQRYPRLVRDTAKGLGKMVRLDMEGTSIGVDRTILSEINDPLVHILRNAIDHGIESLKERLSAGKPEEGVILLKAARERNFVYLEISDDGAGLNLGAIREKAVKMGLLSMEEAESLSDRDAAELITHPNFSTSKDITSLSGRGVGMNVVKTKMDAMGGTVAIESVSGKGCTFRLRLPLSMAVVQALLVRIAGEVYSIPITNVTETIKVDPKRIRQLEHQPVVSYRDGVLPLVNLSERFGGEGQRSAAAISATADTIAVVIVENGPRKAGLMVDALLGQQEVVIKPLKGRLRGTPSMAGATILADGRVSMIVDVNAFF